MRKLYEVAEEIYRVWPKVHPWCKPYLEAMSCLSSMDESYGDDSADSIVAYFLSNASSTWRGEDARRIKAELKSMAGIK